MKKEKTIEEIGKYKGKIHAALYKNDNIKELLLGSISLANPNDMRKLFKEQVKSHLFIDDTIKETKSYIFYDIRMPFMQENIKECELVMYAVCHRDILDNYDKEGFYGNRADILAQMIEDCLVCDEDTSRSFGIGKLKLGSVDVYNGRTLYGRLLTFIVPDFR